MVAGGFRSFFVLVLTVTIAFLGDLKTSLLEIKPTGKHFWISVKDDDRSVKGQNVRRLAQAPSL